MYLVLIERIHVIEGIICIFWKHPVRIHVTGVEKILRAVFAIFIYAIICIKLFIAAIQ